MHKTSEMLKQLYDWEERYRRQAQTMCWKLPGEYGFHL